MCALIALGESAHNQRLHSPQGMESVQNWALWVQWEEQIIDAPGISEPLWQDT